MASFSQRISPSYIALRALLIAAPLVSSLQVTPNSPCSKVCVDSLTLDLSDPNSSNTRNSDIVCKDADLGSPRGTKWKECMTCLQTSTFSQGSESDQTWFLYNLRYSLSYCVFGFPNATDVENTPCRTSMACGNLQENLEHGVLNPTNATAYSYCTGAATRREEYEHCSQCVSAERKTLKLANYLTALEAGCQQQPKPGKFVALNDTIFLDGRVTIVDPTSIIPVSDPKPGLPTNTIIGIVVAGLAVIIIGSAVTFVCYRKRVNRRKRADMEAKYYASGGGGHGGARHKHNSSLSFQCQTHMQSPRFWPGAEGAPGTALSPVNEMGGETEPKMISEHAVTTIEHPASWESAYQQQQAEAQAVQFSRAPSHHSRSTTPNNYSNNNSTSSLPMPKPMPMPTPLHQITTSVPPAAPPNVFTSPSSVTGGYNNSPSDSFSGGAGNMSAVSARSTTALLPINNSSNNGSFRPYIPAEHGIHGSPQSFSASTFSSPVSGTTASPLLKHQTWQQQQQQQINHAQAQAHSQKQQGQQQRVKNFSTPLGASVSVNGNNVSGGNGNTTNGSGTGSGTGTESGNIPPPPPGPPPPKAPRLSLPKKPNKKQPPVTGSPVESTEIKRTFSAPPKK
ncbi:hypothetical protein V8F20_006985 [Naviculisporaceae sp. PSN 640]